MRIISSKELTKEELLDKLSSFLEASVGANTKIVIEEFKLSFDFDGEKYDYNSKNGEEFVFNLNPEVNDTPTKEDTSNYFVEEDNSESFLSLSDLTKWMFIKKTAELKIPSEIENQLEYIGNILYYNEVSYPVYSIENYCINKDLVFLKDSDEQFVPKATVASMLSSHLVENIPTTAICLLDNKFLECVNLSDFEDALGKKIYTSLWNEPTLVTEDSIHNKLCKHLKEIESIGLHYDWYHFGGCSFRKVYDIFSTMQENGLFAITQEEYDEKHFIKYLSDNDINNFPIELKVKVKENISPQGGKVGKYYLGKRDVSPIYQTEKVLSEFTFIPEKDLKATIFRCPISFLYKLKREFSKQNKINSYNQLFPIGFTTNNDLLFDNIPSDIEEIMKIYKMEKEAEKLKKDRSKLVQSF